MRRTLTLWLTVALAAGAASTAVLDRPAAAATTSFSTTVTDTTRSTRCSSRGVDSPVRTLPVRVTAPADAGPHPVLVLAHGLGMDAGLLSGAASDAAGRGYVAVVPSFPLTSPGTRFDVVCGIADLTNQTKDVSFVLTELLARRQGFEQLPAGAADPSRLGIHGISAGGITGLYFFNQCCADPRIRAVSTNIAYPVPTQSRWAWDSTHIPLFMVNARDDPIIPYAQARAGWDAAQPPKFFVSLPGGNPHGSASGPAAVGVARQAFLDRYLKGVPEAEGRLLHAFDGVDPALATFEYVLPIEGPPASVRLAGADRIATAIAASKDAFPAGARAAVLARSTDYPDALAGTPLAAAAGGPLLLTPTDRLDDRVRAELARLLADGATVHVLGGTAALSAAVEDAVRREGFAVTRHAGATRFDTAVSIAAGLGHPSTVLLATGRNFPDALAAGVAAAEAGAAVLLTDGTSMPPSTAAYLSTHPSSRYAVGGPAASAAPDATAVVGSDRAGTAVAAARRFFGATAVIGAATGDTFADALAAGSHLAAKHGPLLLVTRDALPAATRAYVAEHAATITTQYVYGGPAAVSESVRAALHAAAAS